MQTWLPALLAAVLAAAVLAAPVLYLTGRHGAACGATGLALATLAAGSVLAMALNPDPGINATGLAVLAAIVALGSYCLLAVRSPERQHGAFIGGWLGCLALAAGLVYLLVGFRIF